MVAILMPVRLEATAGGFAEHLRAPEDQVVTDHARDQFDQRRVARQIQKSGHTAHPFTVDTPGPLDVG